MQLQRSISSRTRRSVVRDESDQDPGHARDLDNQVDLLALVTRDVKFTAEGDIAEETSTEELIKTRDRWQALCGSVMKHTTQAVARSNTAMNALIINIAVFARAWMEARGMLESAWNGPIECEEYAEAAVRKVISFGKSHKTRVTTGYEVCIFPTTRAEREFEPVARHMPQDSHTS